MSAPCSITQVFAAADQAHQTIKLLPGTYTASIAIQGKTLLVDGFGATVMAMPSDFAFQIQDDSNVRMNGVAIRTGTGPGTFGFDCRLVSTGASPILALDQVDVVSGQDALSEISCNVTVTRSHLGVQSVNDFSVTASNGTVTIDRTLIEDGCVLALGGGAVEVTNSVIRNAGSGGAFVGDGQILGGNAGSMTVSYSTIINSTVTCGTGTPACASGKDTGSCINDSVVLNTLAGAPVNSITTGTSCVTNYSLVFPQAAALNGANNKIGVDPAMKDPTNGDYHLQPGSPAVDAANPGNAGTADFDGTARPQGTRSDMGAFELKQ